MTVRVDFSPQISERLTAAARSRGIDPTTFLEKLVSVRLPTTELVTPPTGRAVEYLRNRLVDEATGDPDEIRKAQEEFDEFKRNMNAERQRAGAAPIF